MVMPAAALTPATSLPPIARSTSSSSRKRAGQDRRSRRAGASSTISPAAPARAIRWSSARCPSSTTARARSRSATCARTTWEDGAAKSYRLQVAELSQPAAGRHGRRQAPSAGGQGRGHADQAEGQEVRSRRRASCSRPSTCAASSRPRARARPSSKFPVFDGSETGEKVYNTLTVIGRVIAPTSGADRCGRRASRRSPA